MATADLQFDPRILLTISLRNAIAGDRGVPQEDLPEDLDSLVALARQDETTEDLRPIRRRKVRRILDALERLDQGTYGRSVVSGEPISAGRLEAMPWAECTAVEGHRRSDVESSIVLDAAAES